MADNVALLQHTLNRFGVVTVMDVLMVDPVTKQPVLNLDTLKVSSINTDGSTKEIRGGMVSDLLLTYNHSRTLNLEMTDALLSLYSLQQLWGATLNDKEVHFNESAKITMGTTKKIIIGPEAVESASGDVVITDKNFVDIAKNKDAYLHVLDVKNNKWLKKDTDFTATWSGKIVTIEFTGASESINEGDEVIVYGASIAEATEGFNPAEVVLKSTSFPSRVSIYGKTVFLDEQTGQEILAEIEIPKFQFGNTFDFSMDAEGDAATFNFAGVALVDAKTKELIKIKTIKRGVHILA